MNAVFCILDLASQSNIIQLIPRLYTYTYTDTIAYQVGDVWSFSNETFAEFVEI